MKGDAYTEFRNLTVNGTVAKIGSCRRCGAAILQHPEDGFNPRQIHDNWHSAQDARSDR